MHFEVLVEDSSGQASLEILIPKIIDVETHTFEVHSYKGIGRIPKGINHLPILKNVFYLTNFQG